MASSVRLRRAGLVAVAVASVFLLAACEPPTGPAENYSGPPVEASDGEEVEVPEGPDSEPTVIWINEGEQLAVTISGSSTCPVVGRDINVVKPAGEGNEVEIDLVERPENEVCTMDFVPHTTVFWTPPDVTTTEPLIVEVSGQSVTVPIK